MLQCLDSNPSNRPSASQLYECLGNWVSDLSSHFGDFVNLKRLKIKILSCHEKAIYFSRSLDSIL
ncbi:hypothetical protein C1645_774526 [Glomus cerebriforme]|uniref:Serine-threonine/tyrosine-protein kinase catalytic domain-containing protein n=1 Tax=Glomus cerebriforme TaxID=658196 RepID=A0A397SR58_9GLOM|nr:hypothetical protein C1645_774526 [Glomus cerebriforme]